MFKTFLWKLAERFAAIQAVPQTSEMRTIEIGRTAIETYWVGRREVIKDFSARFVKEEADKMMEEVVKIANSSDPRMANREKLTSCVIELAQFQVLVIDPPPTEDPTGLRGQLGITGELKTHLAELVRKDKSLREFMHGFPAPKDRGDVWNCVLFRYRQVWAWTRVHHTLRFAFDDVNNAEGKDWFQPFIAAMCAWQEHEYRKLLGMPPALEGDADKEAVKMNLFMEFVLEGARFPDLEWRERAEEVYEEMLAESVSRLLEKRKQEQGKGPEK
jgi:hypothetical protein